ncbi:MAG: signal recognition particle-docking protein FtsY [Firmicutes bacterium]|jgi:fused signal recognition particle receptor|nr:signal recognition particle-docking protein FtsY [Bacillota bacterium]HBG09938.1 signal recognition particle-docking protein FtsY [Bacillota bacterium]
MFGDKPAPEQAKESGFFKKLVSGLEKTKQNLVSKVEQITSGRRVDESLFEELEEVLIEADCGVATAMFLVDQLRERAREEKITEAEELRRVLQEEMVALLEKNAAPLKTPAEKPYVIMVVGVNGAGKTTTIAKLAYRFQQENAKVLLAAGDTFRAGAIEQLGVWANRLGVELIAHQEGSDPAAVAYDAINAAKARDSDVLIIDTAGRLQTKVNLMSELSKIHRVVKRELGRDLDEVLLVVDATTGQNALSQGKIFQEAVPLSGIALTKLDGTAKGGIVLALASELELAVKLVGVGEQYEDLQDFDARAFVAALFGEADS